MECTRMGELLYQLRLEKGLTQKQLANTLNLSDKTISKWERGVGYPDITMLTKLSGFFHVNIEEILQGNLQTNEFVGGNMKNANYYVCPQCNNISICTGNATLSCCGRKLDALVPQKADTNEKLMVEQIEDDWYITSNHPMTKDHYISFVAFATGDKIQMIKQYPEWNLQTRILKRGHGMLLWYCIKDGLFYQLL